MTRTRREESTATNQPPDGSRSLKAVLPLGLNDGCMPGRPSCAYPDLGGHGSIPVLGNSPGSTADNVPGNIFTTDGNAEHFPWRGSTPTMTASSRRPKATSTRRRTDSPTTRGCSSGDALQPLRRDAGDQIGPVLMRFLRARVRDAQEAEDLYQETLMAIHRARHGYDAVRPFEPWLFAIARHIVAAHAERHRVRQAREVLVAAPPERPAESDGHLKPSSSRRFAASPASSAKRSRSSGSRGFRSRRRPAAPG